MTTRTPDRPSLHSRIMVRTAMVLQALAWCAPSMAQDRQPGALTLPQIMALAVKAERQGEPGRARYEVERASGAVRSAEGAFDWSAGASTGYTRIHQYGISGGFLTPDVQRYNVASSMLFAERRLENGIRVRPGMIVTQSERDFQPELARLGNYPLFQVDVPLDRAFGQPVEALRLQSARGDLAAAVADAESARIAYFHGVISRVWALSAARERAAVNAEYFRNAETVYARMGRLARAGEVPASAAEELRARTALGRAVVERDALEVLSARLELGALLHVEAERLFGFAVELPPVAVPDAGNAQLDALVDEALRRRPDVRSQVERAGSAALRARLIEREVESQLSLTVAQDRVQLNWQSPLGDNRRSGARQQALAGIGFAEGALDAARRRVTLETRLAYERRLGAVRVAEHARKAVEGMKERMELTRQLVEGGRQSPAATVDAAEHLASAQRQWIDSRLMHALSLADLRRATAMLPASTEDPEQLVHAFTSVP